MFLRERPNGIFLDQVGRINWPLAVRSGNQALRRTTAMAPYCDVDAFQNKRLNQRHEISVAGKECHLTGIPAIGMHEHVDRDQNVHTLLTCFFSFGNSLSLENVEPS